MNCSFLLEYEAEISIQSFISIGSCTFGRCGQIVNLKGCWNLKLPNDDYVFPQILDLFERNYKIYIIVAWIFAIEDKCCTLGRLTVTRWCTLVTGHQKYIYHHVMTSLSWLSPKVENIWNVCKSNARWWQILQCGWHSHLSIHKGGRDW